MPIYVYKNLTTGERFEIEQRITDSPLDAHPETGDPVKRLVQPVGIAFKGSGFYATDSRASKASGKASKNGASDAAAGSGKDAPAKDAPAKDGSTKDGGKDSGSSAAKETSGAKATSSSDA